MDTTPIICFIVIELTNHILFGRILLKKVNIFNEGHVKMIVQYLGIRVYLFIFQDYITLSSLYISDHFNDIIINLICIHFHKMFTMKNTIYVNARLKGPCH